MKKAATIIAILALMTSCKQKETPLEITKPKQVDNLISKTLLGKDCYTFKGNGNKIELQITENSDGISGNLNYELSEKDKNAGTFKGIIQGDTLIAIYTFQSEGIVSKREVVFLIKNNQLIEGYGAQDTSGTKFKNLGAVQFTSKMPLSKTNCEE